MDTINRGVLTPIVQPTDYVAGAESGIIYKVENSSGDWTQYLPEEETQYFSGFDTSACVTFSALNVIETELNQMQLDSEIRSKLQTLGFIKNNKFNFSDRFTAKMSGTTPQGNHLQTVWDSIRKDGLVPEDMWPSVGAKNWAEYYSEIPQNIKDYGKKILEILEFKYEWIVMNNCYYLDLDLLAKHFKQCPLQIAAPVCNRNQYGVYIPCGSCRTQHATMIYGIKTGPLYDIVKMFDHYYPYYNDLRGDYTIPWIMKATTTVKTPPETPELPQFNHSFQVDIYYNQRSEEVSWLQKGLNLLGKYNIPVTGYYGNITRNAVLDFQKKNKVDNIIALTFLNGKVVGPKTRAKLNTILK